MPDRHTFVVNDENVINSHGFRVLTAGIDLKQFKKNPLVLWMHKRPSRWDANDKDKERFPIGLAYNLRKDPENPALLLADVEFDQDDEFAKSIEKKVQSKHIRMCSAGLYPIDLSDDPKHLLQGQTRRSLTKSELIEISIVPFGSNPNSVKLYGTDMEAVELSADNLDSFVPLVNDTNNSNNDNSNTKTMSDSNKDLRVMLAAGLGMDENTSESEMLRHVIQLNTENANLKQQVTTLENEKAEAEKATELEAKTTMLDEAVKAKKITEAQRKAYAKMELADLKVALEGLQPATDLSDVPGSTSGKSPWEQRMEEINKE